MGGKQSFKIKATSQANGHPVPPNRHARVGELVVPLSGGRYHRQALGVPIRVGAIDPALGILFAETSSGGSFGWQTDPRPLGRRVCRPYLDLHAPYVAGVTKADLVELQAAADLKAKRMLELEDAYRRSIAEIDRRYYNSARQVQSAIDACISAPLGPDFVMK